MKLRVDRACTPDRLAAAERIPREVTTSPVELNTARPQPRAGPDRVNTNEGRRSEVDVCEPAFRLSSFSSRGRSRWRAIHSAIEDEASDTRPKATRPGSEHERCNDFLLSCRDEKHSRTNSVLRIEISRTLLRVLFMLFIALVALCFAILYSLAIRACLFRGRDCVIHEALSLALSSSVDSREAVWVEHVVTSRDNSVVTLDIPATFCSRLNADLAPMMANHSHDIWGATESPVLLCKSPEVLMVSFSLQKSSRLPASVSFDDCDTECPRNRSIRDIRDIRVTLPMHASRRSIYAQVADERQAPSDLMGYPRRYESWGKVRGRLIIDLSDTGKLALQRYCGESENDVDVEPLNPVDIRLVTVYELKRLYSLWTYGEVLSASEANSDFLFHAVVRPLDYVDTTPLTAVLHEFQRRLDKPSAG